MIRFLKFYFLYLYESVKNLFINSIEFTNPVLSKKTDKISFQVDQNLLFVECPSEASVDLLTVLGWKRIASSEYELPLSPIRKLKFLDPPVILKFSFSEGENYYLSSNSRQASLRMSSEDVGVDVLVSTLFHAALCFLFVFLLRAQEKGGRLVSPMDKKENTQVLVPVKFNPPPAISLNPFRGFNEIVVGEHKIKVLTHKQINKLKTFTKTLGALSKLQAMNNTPPEGQGGAALGSEKDFQAGAQALLQNTQDLNLNVAMLGKNQKDKDIDPAAQARVRALFNRYQHKFSQAYDKALKVDSTLSLSLHYSGRVKDSGYLGDVEFSPQGVYSEAGLKVLKQEMENILESIFIGKDLSGVKIQGDRLFIQ